MKHLFFILAIILAAQLDEVRSPNYISIQEKEVEEVINYSVDPLQGPLLGEITLLPDATYVYLDDLYFRNTFETVMECESNNNPIAHRKVSVRSVIYDVMGSMQLLVDAKILSITHELGYTKNDLLSFGPNVLVALEWYKRNGGWWPWLDSHKCWGKLVNFTP